MASVSDSTDDQSVRNPTGQNRFVALAEPGTQAFISSAKTCLSTDRANTLLCRCRKITFPEASLIQVSQPVSDSESNAPRCDSSVEGLPIEILVEIYNFLPWRDVLRVRQTCRGLAYVSSARPIWAHQYRRLCDHVTVPPLMGKPVELRSSQELETITLGRIRSELNWNSHKAVPQTIHIEPPFPNSRLFPVPGGRWVLVGVQDTGRGGSVYVYDIQAPMPQEPLPFIVLQEDLEGQDFIGLDIDVDYDEPQLTFTVCLVHMPHVGSLPSSPGAAIFYRVTQIGHGSNARLEAVKLKSLLLPVTGGCLYSIIYGRYYARWHSLRVNGTDTQEDRIEIYDWLSSQSESLVAFLLVSSKRPHRFQIVAGKKLVVFWEKAIEVFDFATFAATQADVLDSSLSLKPYWFKDGLDTCTLEPVICHPYFHAKSASTRLAYDTDTAIYGISIPIDSSAPQIHLLWDEPVDIAAGLGIDKFFCAPQNSQLMRRGSFRWPTDSEGTSAGDDEFEYGRSEVIEFQAPCKLEDLAPLMESSAITGVAFGGYSMYIFVF